MVNYTPLVNLLQTKHFARVGALLIVGLETPTVIRLHEDLILSLSSE